MYFKNITLFLISVLLLSSCAMSKTFHRPQPLDRSIADYAYFTSGKDTTLIRYHQSTHHIDLLRPDSSLINQDYSIQNSYFESSSGNRLNLWVMTPKSGEIKATILHFHGSAANLINQYQAIAPLLDYGYQVFSFDYSGYGFSEGKASRKNVLADAYAALSHVYGHERSKSEILLLYGQSYGGYLAAVVGANSEDKIDGLIIEGAFSTHKAEARYTVPIVGNVVKNEAKAHVEIRTNRKPLLVIHSREDKRVPIKFGRKIFENAKEPKTFYEIDQKHIAGLQFYAEEIAAKIDQLLSGTGR